MSQPSKITFRDAITHALPNDAKRVHILALGEMHNVKNHHALLREALSDLIKQHNLGTIGFEAPYYFNLFFNRYAKICSEHPLDSEIVKKERDYLRDLIVYDCDDKNTAARAEAAKWITDAIEKGLRVVAFDTRDFIHKNKLGWLIEPLKEEAQQGGISLEALQEEIRYNRTEREAVLKRAVSYQKNAHAELFKTRPELEAGFEKAIFTLWASNEAENVIEADHDNTLFTTTERLIEEGKKRGICHDALSAGLLRASAVPAKNIITISGAAHLWGDDDRKSVNGTFHHHLAAIRWNNHPKPFVTPLIVVNRESRGLISQEWKKSTIESPNKLIINTGIPAMLDVESNEMVMPRLPKQSIWQQMADVPKYVPFDFRYQREFANPALVPQIHKAMESIAQAWSANKAQSPIR